jgi:outer membrane protein assembly factor BamE (lipoprotein component of BamABCDE complex)
MDWKLPPKSANRIAIALVALAAVSALAWWKIDEYRSRVPFDPQVWRAAAKAHSDRTRSRMLHDLMDRHALKGMHRTEVLELLGAPESGRSFETWDMAYRLGPYFIDSEWLVLRLDATQRAVEFRVVTD